MARSQSAAVPNGTVCTTSSVAGFKTSQVPPFEASTHSPPMYCLYDMGSDHVRS